MATAAPPAGRQGSLHPHHRPPAPRGQRQYRGGEDEEVGEVGGGDTGAQQAISDLAGVYSTAEAAARAYDTAVYLLSGRSARLNFPDEVPADACYDGGGGEPQLALSAASVRKKAIEVGARVDASLRTMPASSPPQPQPRPSRPTKNPDLNQAPSPDSSDVGRQL
ncbi:hypothetical protein C4D60_Mb08t19440 [Musa balbisiana]|uniref:AP2/ERF domain-containing protein n=1 Tax=Musa balbisiana TaxID=52838 RepID=A0A4S8K4Z7_MUSBA|nr:hypothetical protein C4D60_Mb08t19440 [Musa balbisiana]